MIDYQNIKAGDEIEFYFGKEIKREKISEIINHQNISGFSVNMEGLPPRYLVPRKDIIAHYPKTP